MTIRTSDKTVTLRKPFVLGRSDEVLPAGSYTVETDEKPLEGISFLAYRRILTLIHLHAESGHPGRMRTLTIDPNDLDAALKRDQAPEEMADGSGAGQKTTGKITEADWEDTDRQGTERGENEGMIVHPR